MSGVEMLSLHPKNVVRLGRFKGHKTWKTGRRLNPMNSRVEATIHKVLVSAGTFGYLASCANPGSMTRLRV